MIKYISILLALIFFISCNQGLEPEPISYLRGTVYFSDKDTWPPIDSLNDLLVVALKNFPPEDLIIEVVSGNVYFSETLPFLQDSVEFELEIFDAPVDLKYIGVAQNYGEVLDWKVVGVYSENFDNNHSSFFIEQGIADTIKIFVDFNNIPEQPFEVK